MKINSNIPPENQAAAQNAQNIQKNQAVESRDKPAQAKPAGPADKVDISTRSKEIADIMSAVNQLPETRDQKVQEIKKSVDAGTYTVDPRNVANKIISEM